MPKGLDTWILQPAPSFPVGMPYAKANYNQEVVWRKGLKQEELVTQVQCLMTLGEDVFIFSLVTKLPLAQTGLEIGP